MIMEVSSMIFNTKLTIAIKNSLGQYDINEFTLFQIEKLNKITRGINIINRKKREINLQVKCPICGEYHNYSYNVSEFLKRYMIIGGCESLGLPIFYIGEKDNIRKTVNKYNYISKKLYAMI